MRWSAVIPAAGNSSRFGNAKLPKQYCHVNGKPLLFYTLRRLEESQRFFKIILVVDEAYLKTVRHDILEAYDLAKTVAYEIVQGGASRAASVFSGLKAAQGSDFVAIHDGARPCLSHKLLETLLGETERWGAVVPGLPLNDTIKQIQDGLVTGTVDRSRLWSVQTPQCFSYALVLEAYAKALESGASGTDDAEVVERLGKSVRVIIGEASNLKVTYPEDLARLESWLAGSHV